jgi:hypothetical protein
MRADKIGRWIGRAAVVVVAVGVALVAVGASANAGSIFDRSGSSTAAPATVAHLDEIIWD